MLLGDFLSAMPRDIKGKNKQPQQLNPGSRGSPATAAWGGGAGRTTAHLLTETSAPAASTSGGASLRMIQAEQEFMSNLTSAAATGIAQHPSGSSSGGGGLRRAPPLGAVPYSSSHGASQAPLYGSSPPAAGSSPVISKWYVPDREKPRQALTSIQTEEAAIAQLQQMYGSNVQIRVAAPKFNMNP